jgi:DNA-binding beta-propeller fold protein YncE
MTVAGVRPTYAAVPGWGKLPDGWSFVEATAVGVDSKDNVYVYNRGAHPVIIFDRHGKFLRSWGEGMTSRAHGITIGPDDTIWLTDDGNHTVRQYSPDGKLILSIGDPDKPSPAHGGKPFNRPTHVALSPQTGDVYISDGYGNSRVHKYDPKGRLLFSWGEPGTDPGCFNIPHNIASTWRTGRTIASRYSTRGDTTSIRSTTCTGPARCTLTARTAGGSSWASCRPICR